MAKKTTTKKTAKPKLTTDGFAMKVMLRIKPEDIKHYTKLKGTYNKKQMTDNIQLAVINAPDYINEIEFLKGELYHTKQLLNRLQTAIVTKITADKNMISEIDFIIKHKKYDPKNQVKQVSMSEVDDFDVDDDEDY